MGWRTAENTTILDSRVSRVRRFNRLYTKTIGVLSDGLLDSPYSLTEVRVLYELRHAPAADAAALCETLELDAGYLSRILARFDRDGLIERHRSPSDRRRRILSLTARGATTFDTLDERQIAAVAELLTALDDDRQREVVSAMGSIETALSGKSAEPRPTLREPRPGELGWAIARNGAVYAAEHGWNGEYEALVAKVIADYAADHDPARERGWIADLDGVPVGSIFCMSGDDPGTAKLRVLLVEPFARGRGIGGLLVGACVDFAREAGYRDMVLWTVSLLADARRIYQRAGFSLRSEEAVHMFGHDLTAQTWGREL
ncbi:MAG: bifunctional helix-turn-helix transcriptional regulator/GNAT family N-acetyltransferase [Stackebrandtia sp.]